MGQTDPEELMPEDNDPKNAIGYKPPTKHQPSGKSVHSALTKELVEMDPEKATIRNLREEMNKTPGSDYEIAEIKRKRQKDSEEHSN